MLFKRVLSGIPFKKQDLFIDIMKFLMFLFALLSIFAILYSAVNVPDIAIMHLYLLLIPASLSFLMSRIPLKLWQMLLCQAVLIVSPLVMLLFSPFYESIVAIAMMIIIATVSLSSRYRYHDRTSVSFETLGASAATHAILLALCTFFPSGNLPYVLLSHALISICLFFSARQKYAFETAYGHIVNSPTQPSGQVKRLNTRILIFLFIISLAVIPLSVYFPYSILYSFLATVLKWILIGITAIYNFLKWLHLLPEISEIDPISEITKETTESNNKTLEFFQYALMIIILAAFCITLFLGIKKIILFIIARYRRALPGKIMFPTELIHDEIISLEKNRVKRFRRIDFGKGKEKEVRKLYYIAVKKEIRSGAVITASQSPCEIGRAIKNSSGNDFTELTSRYELFRYGDESDVLKTRQNKEK
jgi:hypothetical protein